jgi:hypothetical protein
VQHDLNGSDSVAMRGSKLIFRNDFASIRCRDIMATQEIRAALVLPMLANDAAERCRFDGLCKVLCEQACPFTCRMTVWKSGPSSFVQLISAAFRSCFWTK